MGFMASRILATRVFVHHRTQASTKANNKSRNFLSLVRFPWSPVIFPPKGPVMLRHVMTSPFVVRQPMFAMFKWWLQSFCYVKRVIISSRNCYHEQYQYLLFAYTLSFPTNHAQVLITVHGFVGISTDLQINSSGDVNRLLPSVLVLSRRVVKQGHQPTDHGQNIHSVYQLVLTRWHTNASATWVTIDSRNGLVPSHDTNRTCY